MEVSILIFDKTSVNTQFQQIIGHKNIEQENFRALPCTLYTVLLLENRHILIDICKITRILAKWAYIDLYNI